MKQILLLIICLVIFTGCGVSEKNYQSRLNDLAKATQRINDLECKIVILETEIEYYKFSTENIIALMQQNLKDKKYNEIKVNLMQIKKYHPNSMQINKAEEIARIAQINEQTEIKEKLEAISKLKKKYDDISHITWYYNPYFTHYNNSNKTSLYLGTDNSNEWLRLCMSYTGEDWIFFENAYLMYDGITVPILFDNYKDKKTENKSTVWEWIDISVSSELLVHLRKLVNSKIVKVRLSGKYTNTRSLSKIEINGIRDVIAGYDLLLSQRKK